MGGEEGTLREGPGDVAGGSSNGGQLNRPRWHSWYCDSRCCLNNFMGTISGRQGFVWALGRMFFIPDSPPSAAPQEAALAVGWICSQQSRLCHGPALCREDFLTAGIPQTITKMGQNPPDSTTSEAAPCVSFFLFQLKPSLELGFLQHPVQSCFLEQIAITQVC